MRKEEHTNAGVKWYLSVRKKEVSHIQGWKTKVLEQAISNLGK